MADPLSTPTSRIQKEPLAPTRIQVTLGWTLVVLLLVAGVGRLGWRAVPGMLTRSPDFRTPWLSAVAWKQGQNPYEHENLVRIWIEGGGDPADAPVKYYTPSVYPPSSFAVLAPWTVMPWTVARPVWLAFSMLMAALAMASLLSLANLPPNSLRAWLLVSGTLLLGPLSVCLQLGQPTLAAVAALPIAMWLDRRGRATAAGVVLGLAMALKPQLAGVLWAIWVWRALGRGAGMGQWRAVVVSGGLALGILATALVRLHASGTPWLAAWLQTLHEASTNGGFNDPTAANPDRFHLLNLQFLLHGIVSSRPAVTALTGLLTVGLLAAFATVHGRERSSLLAVSTLLVISLLPLYHRYYDGLLLILPLAWLVQRGLLDRIAVACLLGLAPFVVSWADLLHQLEKSGAISSAFAQSWVWQAILLPCQVWALLWLVGAMLLAARRSRLA